MKSYTTLRNLYGSLSLDSGATNLTLGDQLLNDGMRKVLAIMQWPFLEKTDTSKTTVASQQGYKLPYNLGKLINATVTIGNYIYTPREVTSRDDWDRLNMVTNYQSNIPVYFYIYNGTWNVWPVPSTSGNQITFNYKVGVKDLTIADYTTGTITTSSTTSGVTTLTGSGTTWTASMVGRFIRIDESAGGDGFWYEIATVPSTTSMTLLRTYGGTALSAASATYTIGQMPLLPEEYHILPVYYALWQYFLQKTDDIYTAKIKSYANLYSDSLQQMKEDYGEKSTSPVVDAGKSYSFINPNLTLNQ